MTRTQSVLVLADGAVFEGYAAGYLPDDGVTTGEFVFNTALSGYQEVITDPSYLHEFTTTFGLTAARARRLRPETLLMHPGPINRGVELDSVVADLPAAIIERQVSNGVPIRMAVLYLTVAGVTSEVA